MAAERGNPLFGIDRFPEMTARKNCPARWPGKFGRFNSEKIGNAINAAPRAVIRLN
jgi:hypothetical protein